MIDAVEEEGDNGIYDNGDNVNGGGEGVGAGAAGSAGGEGEGGVVKGLGFADCFDVHHDVRALVLEVGHLLIDLSIAWTSQLFINLLIDRMNDRTLLFTSNNTHPQYNHNHHVTFSAPHFLPPLISSPPLPPSSSFIRTL